MFWVIFLVACIIWIAINESEAAANRRPSVPMKGLRCNRPGCGFTLNPGADPAARMSAVNALQTHLLVHAQQDNTPRPSAPPMSMN